MNAKAKFVNVVRRNLFGIQLLVLMRGVHPSEYIVQKGKTGICIEGYPRSANTFFVYLFQTANDVHVGHHTHSTAHVGRALRYGIPAVVLIRSPVEAITSSVLALGRDDIDDEVYRYITFYRWVVPRQEKVVIARFETATGDGNAVIKRTNDKYRTRFNLIENLDAAEKEVKQILDNRFAKGGESNERFAWIPRSLRSVLPDVLFEMEDQENATVRWKPIPVTGRDAAKQEIRPRVEDHELIGEAHSLYETLVSSPNAV